MATKKTKKKLEPREQLKMKGTGRLDAIESIEKVAAREQAEVAEDEACASLTEVLIANGKSEYQYEGKDGQPYIAYVPKAQQPKARVRKVKREKPKKSE